MSKKEKRESSGGGYDFNATLGDMMTNLLTFFVLLYSFAMSTSVDAGKSSWNALVLAFTGSPPSTAISVDYATVNSGAVGFTQGSEADSSLNGKGDGLMDRDGTIGGPINSQDQINENFDELYENIQNYISTNNLGYSIVAEKIEDIIIVRVLDGVIFESGSAEVIQTDNKVLVDIGNMFGESQQIIHQIQVEGHTDTVPIHNAQFEDNWDLSAKRATNVVRYLSQNHGISWEKFSAAGYGEYRPIAENTTDAGRRQNRRVNFIIERAVITELQTNNATDTTASTTSTTTSSTQSNTNN